MKSKFWSRFWAAGCCAALCLGLLAGCGETAASSTPAASSQVLSEAPASEAVPSGGSDTTTAPGVDDSENSFGLTDPAGAFSAGLGWGPGAAGASLKSMAAAASMMSWAGENGLAHRSAGSLSDCLSAWYGALSTPDQENFAEAWPLIGDAAQRILDDPAAAASELEDAGVKEAPDCSSADWSALAGALDAIVPAPQQ